MAMWTGGQTVEGLALKGLVWEASARQTAKGPGRKASRNFSWAMQASEANYSCCSSTQPLIFGQYLGFWTWTKQLLGACWLGIQFETNSASSAKSSRCKAQNTGTGTALQLATSPTEKNKESLLGWEEGKLLDRRPGPDGNMRKQLPDQHACICTLPSLTCTHLYSSDVLCITKGQDSKVVYSPIH